MCAGLDRAYAVGMQGVWRVTQGVLGGRRGEAHHGQAVVPQGGHVSLQLLTLLFQLEVVSGDLPPSLEQVLHRQRPHSQLCESQRG